MEEFKALNTTSVLNDFFMRIQNYRIEHDGEPPPELYLLPSEFLAVTQAVDCYKTDHAAFMDLAGGTHVFGVHIVVVPFHRDPLFKRFQAMARLVGARIDYYDGTVAEFYQGGAGWRFVKGVVSQLYPITHKWPAPLWIQE